MRFKLPPLRRGLPMRMRHRRILIAVAATVAVFAGIFCFNQVAQGRRDAAVSNDIDAILEQTTEQLERSLISRRGTLTFIRDILNRQDLNGQQLTAVGASATEHTRHLLGTGLAQAGRPDAWWYGPAALSDEEKRALDKAVDQRTRLRGVWRVPSTLVAWISADRPVLIMLEPLKTGRLPNSAVIGVFDLKPLLKDFFSSGLPQRHPAQVLAEDQVLYRGKDWRSSLQEDKIPLHISSERLNMDAARWRLEMQPGKNTLVETLSWVSVLLVALSVFVGVTVVAFIWLLAARTWVLQQAVRRRTAALRRTTARLRQLATTDELTGLYNRRFFMQRWILECQRSQRYHRPLACLMIDINKFKQVNDTLGHDTGDALLKAVSRKLEQMLRQTDLLARFGGDEFIVALPETTPEQAEKVVDKLRGISIPVPEAAYFPEITLSVGMAANRDTPNDPDALVKAADEALYVYKRRITAGGAFHAAKRTSV